MPVICTIWQKAVELPVGKVNEVVHGAQDAELIVVMPSTVPIFNSRRIGKGKKLVQRPVE